MQQIYIAEPFKGRLKKRKDKTNAERFLDAFISIERSLNRIEDTHDYIPFGNLIKKASKHNPVIKNRYESLKEYCELRNAIVHQRGGRTEIIAEPNRFVTEDIERIAEQLLADHAIANYATKPVRYVYGEDSVEDAFQCMQETHATKLPVYEGKKCVGLLCLEAITKWAMEGKKPNTTVRDVLNESGVERVVFVDRLATIQDVIRIFDHNMKHHRPAPVIIVSEHGLSTEKPFAILSSYDLTRIIAVLA